MAHIILIIIDNKLCVSKTMHETPCYLCVQIKGQIGIVDEENESTNDSLKQWCNQFHTNFVQYALSTFNIAVQMEKKVKIDVYCDASFRFTFY